MSLQLLVSADGGNVYADAFLVIKPQRNGHDKGTIAEIFERGQVFLGYARLESCTTLRVEQISDNLALAICSHPAPYLKALLAKWYPGEVLFDVMGMRWTERNLESFRVLTQCRWDKIINTTPMSSHYPQLSIHLK
jgi:hypothetical protein